MDRPSNDSVLRSMNKTELAEFLASWAFEAMLHNESRWMFNPKMVRFWLNERSEVIKGEWSERGTTRTLVIKDMEEGE